MQSVKELNINQIEAGNNDRTQFNEKALQELADSIRSHGLIQPITVRRISQSGASGRYQIIAGERRFRAHKLAGLPTIRAIVSNLDDETAAAAMLAENVARADLDPIDEAFAYQTRIDQYGWTVKDCAQRAGVSTVRVQFRLKLLSLRGDLQELVRKGTLPIGYAQTISDANLDPNFQIEAIKALNSNPSPSPAWLRRICGQLANKQNQPSLVDMFIDTGKLVLMDMPSVNNHDDTLPIPSATAKITPETPATVIPPRAGNSLHEIIENQIEFWTNHANAWEFLGRPFEKRECIAAVNALQAVIA